MNNKFYFNEFKHPGIDHSNMEYAKKYDQKMLKFRNYENEAKQLADLLQISNNDVIIDFGCGTGALSIPLASYSKYVYGIDSSEAMLTIAKEKADKMQIKNIEFINSGFLNYIHKGQTPTVVTTIAAMHHLPDFWKVIAMKNIHKILGKGGKFLLSDVIFSFDIDDYEKTFNNWINDIANKVDKEFSEEGVIHFREEFSTFDWLIEEMLKRTGFNIKKKIVFDKLNILYYCRK